MTTRVRSCTSAPPHIKARLLLVSALLSVFLGTAAGCQGRREPSTQPVQVVLDSLLVANEALFDSTTANLAWDRLSCLERRAEAAFGSEKALQIATEAEQRVRARHSRAEYAAGHPGIKMAHDVPDDITCARIDSLWYATVVKQRRRHP